MAVVHAALVIEPLAVDSSQSSSMKLYSRKGTCLSKKTILPGAVDVRWTVFISIGRRLVRAVILLFFVFVFRQPINQLNPGPRRRNVPASNVNLSLNEMLVPRQLLTMRLTGKWLFERKNL